MIMKYKHPVIIMYTGDSMFSSCFAIISLKIKPIGLLLNKIFEFTNN